MSIPQQLAVSAHWDRDDIEARIAHVLARMTGGASKEQFAFTLRHDDAAEAERLVLRMAPWMGIVETCRGREAQLLKAFAGVVPVPPLRFVDGDGDHLGQPGLIMRMVAGNTAPSDIATKAVTGVGIRFEHWMPKLAPQFIDNLARIHGFDWRRAELSYFDAPAAGTTQAALRQVNWWARVWQQDLVEPDPLVTVVERWLRENAPVCAQPVVVHGDYRIGNFMFVEPSGDFSAVLDINNASACRAARESHSHQDLVLTWMAFGSAVFMAELDELLRDAQI